jgi:two-component system sensor histidine kinase/response regulator
LNRNKPIVLIVDDIPKNLQVLGAILGGNEYEIAVASNGEQALKTAVAIKPDLILLDVMMPGMDGFEVCKNIRNETTISGIPIIFITGRAELDDITQALMQVQMTILPNHFIQASLSAG